MDDDACSEITARADGYIRSRRLDPTLANFRLLAPEALVRQYQRDKGFEQPSDAKFNKLIDLADLDSRSRLEWCDYFLQLTGLCRKARGDKNVTPSPRTSKGLQQIECLDDDLREAREKLKGAIRTVNEATDDETSGMRALLCACGGSDRPGEQQQQLEQALSKIESVQSVLRETNKWARGVRKTAAAFPHYLDAGAEDGKGGTHRGWVTLLAMNVRTVYRSHSYHHTKQKLYQTVSLLTSMMVGDDDSPGPSGIRHHLENRAPKVHEAVRNYESWPRMEARGPFGRRVSVNEGRTHLKSECETYSDRDDLSDPVEFVLFELRRAWEQFARYARQR